jgi:hypothetical protein
MMIMFVGPRIPMMILQYWLLKSLEQFYKLFV